MRKKILLLIPVLFLILLTYSFFVMSSKENKKFSKQWLTAMKNNDEKTLISLNKKYIKEYPNEDYPYEYLGTTYLRLENYEEAEKNILKAIELGNKDTAVFTLVALLSAQEKFEEAEETSKKINEIFMNNPMTILEVVRDAKTFAIFLDDFNSQWFLADFYKTHLNDDKEAKKWAQKALNRSKKIPKSEQDEDYANKLKEIEGILK